MAGVDERLADWTLSSSPVSFLDHLSLSPCFLWVSSPGCFWKMLTTSSHHLTHIFGDESQVLSFTEISPGRMDTCLCMAECLCCSSETTTTLLIGYSPIQNKKFKVWRKNKKISPDDSNVIQAKNWWFKKSLNSKSQLTLARPNPKPNRALMLPTPRALWLPPYILSLVPSSPSPLPVLTLLHWPSSPSFSAHRAGQLWIKSSILDLLFLATHTTGLSPPSGLPPQWSHHG